MTRQRKSRRRTRQKLARHVFARVANTKDEWLTPRYIIEALGPFDLDPCASIVRPWPTAVRHFTVADDGLSREWFGRVWLNPPYGLECRKWISRLIDHGQGIALVAARTSTRWFHRASKAATAVLFLEGKIAFCDTAGRSGQQACFPSVFFAFGDAAARALREAVERGVLKGLLVSWRAAA